MLFDFPDLSDRLLLAIPKKGRLHEKCMSILTKADLKFTTNHPEIALSSSLPLALLFLPASDIPLFVANGNIHLGITGQDVILEAQVSTKVKELLKLEFGKCDLCVQVPNTSTITCIEQLVGKRIVTSFDRITEHTFNQLEIEYAARNNIPVGSCKTRIQFISGSVEAACTLGKPDAIVDLVESGDTMRAAKLHAIHTIMSSQAVLIENTTHTLDADKRNLVSMIKRRIKGVVDAEKFVLCNYNVERRLLKQAIVITPGSKAPTISPLEDNEWVSVSCMVNKKEVVKVVDSLESLGATDILVFNIQNCRINQTEL